ncbi:P-loop containing nucleoside triphosphate hydrolase protein, partial [Amylostereum chailletii]
IKAVALDRYYIQVAREQQGRNVLKEVCQCIWEVVIVSPERLTAREFDMVLRDVYFLQNLVLYTVDEAHVICPWSKAFHEAFGQIDRVRERIGPHIPILLMTATLSLEPEKKLLEEFPEIAWAVTAKAKILVYCKDYDTCFRVASYLRSNVVAGANAETLEAFQNNPEYFIVMATVKFRMGVDLRRVDYVLIMGLPDTAEAIPQYDGRAGR